MIEALRRHWPEYLIEGALLGTFMIAACAFGALIEHPASPVRQAVADPVLRRALMGIAMGGTAITLIYSRWGRRSGAHMNPATTLTFMRLGRVAPVDALFYTAAQFMGGVVGVLLAGSLLDTALRDAAVHYVTTVPGEHGVGVAFVAEVAITLLLIIVVLETAASPRLMRYTGVCSGLLVATYITFEAPFSGMSLNPARTFGSAVGAASYTAIWIYFVAPPLGMLTAAQVYLWLRGRHRVPCAKLCHISGEGCIFCERTAALGRPPAAPFDSRGEASVIPTRASHASAPTPARGRGPSRNETPAPTGSWLRDASSCRRPTMQS